MRSGVVDNLAENEEDALHQIQTFVSYLPDNYMNLAPAISTKDKINRQEEELLSIIPVDRRKAYNMRKLLGFILDKALF